MALRGNHRTVVFGSSALVAAILGVSFVRAVSPPTLPERAELREVRIEKGDGSSAIARSLDAAGVVRSASAFGLLALFRGDARALKPGRYLLSTASSSGEILDALVGGPPRDVELTIPEGATIYQIDALLADAGVLAPGDLLDAARTMSAPLEGRLYPDRYRFFADTTASAVIEKFSANFSEKTREILGGLDADEAERALIMASLVEREVPDGDDRRIVAGIIEKRLAAGMPLQVDATICYAKQIVAQAYAPCLPFALGDFDIESPFNTYRNSGLPPGPISNPGTDALRAALEPRGSPYWYYLSDPKTGDTIYARTFEEHRKNRARYLN